MVWLIPMAIGAAAAAANNREQQKQAERGDQANALETKYSPWVNPNYQSVSRPGSMTGAILGGAASGAMMGAQMGNMGGGQTQQANFVGDANVSPNMGGSGWMSKPRAFNDDMNRKSFMTA
jgi:predicted lipid-binding transport protein (Tim44 family)